MKTNYSTRSLKALRRYCALLAIPLGLMAATTSLNAGEEIPLKLVIQLDSSSGSSGVGGGDGGDIIVWDIVDSATKSECCRAAGGGGGGDIIVFDIIDSAVDSVRKAVSGGGGNIIVFDIVDSAAEIFMSTEPSADGVYKALLVEDDLLVGGLTAFQETSEGKIVLSFIF